MKNMRIKSYMKRKTKNPHIAFAETVANEYKEKQNKGDLVFDGSTYHKIIAFKESDGHQFADSIELEMDALKRWRVKHYQERWMEKKDMIKFYELMLDVIKKL